MGALDDPKHKNRLPYDYVNREYGTVPPDNKRAPFRWVSEVAYKNTHRIVARGYDTTELVEAGYGLVDVLFVDYQGRIPLSEEAEMLNYVMLLGLEDGLSSPAAVARITAGSKVFLTQGCGASVLAFGHAFGAYCAFGQMLDKYLRMVDEGSISEEEAALLLAAENRDAPHLGVSDLMLKDPAARRTLERAEKLGLARRYVPFMRQVVEAAKSRSDSPVDIDMLGALGAVMFDLGFTPEATWGILAITRAFAAGAHWIEEIERGDGFQRLGQTLTPEEDYDGPEERPVPSLDERERVAKPGQAQTLEEWKANFVEKQKLKGSGFSIIENIQRPGSLPTQGKGK